MLEEIIAPLLSTEWGRRCGLAAIIIFSLLLLAAVIEMPIIWHEDYLLTHAQVIPKTTQPLSDKTIALIQQLPELHLFGLAKENLPITNLQLHLIGIVQATPDSASHAIISEAGQPGKSYQIGDSLVSGVRIKKITADGVILENDGQMEKLLLSRPPLTFEGMPKNILPGE
jgi:type II secretory pathway component PulC